MHFTMPYLRISYVFKMDTEGLGYYWDYNYDSFVEPFLTDDNFYPCERYGGSKAY